MMKLQSIDQDTEEGRYCPKCGGEWRAGQIKQEYIDDGSFGHREPCEVKRTWDDDYDPTVPCTCGPRYYSHLVGRVWNDRIQEWSCPFCSTRWNRRTMEEIECETGHEKESAAE